WVNRRVDRQALAKRFFTQRESELVLADPGSGRFFQIWTRKEAVLKTNGVGLRVPLDSFEVLTDDVSPEAIGRPLRLRTEVRTDEYTVSWAVPTECADQSVSWVTSDQDDWLQQVEDAL
ncbi:MAG: 4-phosphopantetheinyl transferase family protein, partial [Candidatus Eremiobacteraeota bacterium]|nr:4-phosphopantetheinyl transferase family protein [Candidatus Eremiobacteraeota bacterium]